MSPSKRQKQNNQKTFDFEDSENGNGPADTKTDDSGNEKAPLARSYKNWFLEYASYVILDRAVPAPQFEEEVRAFTSRIVAAPRENLLRTKAKVLARLGVAEKTKTLDL